MSLFLWVVLKGVRGVIAAVVVVGGMTLIIYLTGLTAEKLGRLLVGLGAMAGVVWVYMLLGDCRPFRDKDEGDDDEREELKKYVMWLPCSTATALRNATMRSFQPSHDEFIEEAIREKLDRRARREQPDTWEHKMNNVYMPRRSTHPLERVKVMLQCLTMAAVHHAAHERDSTVADVIEQAIRDQLNVKG